jgi:hypothetical protein
MFRPRPQRSLGRPPALSSTIFRLEEANRHHWPTHSDKRMNCRVCSTRGKRRSIHTKCEKYDVGLCILSYFNKYHTKARFSSMTRGVKPYIHQTDNKKSMYIKFCYIFFNTFLYIICRIYNQFICSISTGSRTNLDITHIPFSVVVHLGII